MLLKTTSCRKPYLKNDLSYYLYNVETSRCTITSCPWYEYMGGMLQVDDILNERHANVKTTSKTTFLPNFFPHLSIAVFFLLLFHVTKCLMIWKQLLISIRMLQFSKLKIWFVSSKWSSSSKDVCIMKGWEPIMEGTIEYRLPNFIISTFMHHKSA